MSEIDRDYEAACEYGMAVALALPAEMAQAHEAWRNNLAATSLAEIIAAWPHQPQPALACA
jgi:hypothetical protein